MAISINKSYVFNFDIDGHNLTYTGTVIEIDSMFITFKDKFNNIVTYNLSKLSSAKELQDG